MKLIVSSLLTGVIAYALVYFGSMFITQDLRILVLMTAASFFVAGWFHGNKSGLTLRIMLINLLLLLQTALVIAGREEAPFVLLTATTIACTYLGAAMRRNWSEWTGRRVGLLVAATSVYLFVIGFVAMPRVVEAANTKAAGGLAPTFELESLDGGRISSDDYKGRVLVLNIWATTCSNCIQELPELQKLYETYRGDDRIKFLAVSSKFGMDTPEKVRRFVERKGLDLPWAHDTSGKFVESLKLENIPCTMIIDGNGIVRMLHIGFNPSEDFINNMAKEINAVLVD